MKSPTQLHLTEMLQHLKNVTVEKCIVGRPGHPCCVVHQEWRRVGGTHIDMVYLYEPAFWGTFMPILV